MQCTFDDFGFCEGLSEGLSVMGYTKPTTIQEQAIPLVREGHDLVGCAQTGTGKTAAFLLPILDRIAQRREEHRLTSVLIIAPTRELALQIDQQVEGFAYFIPVTSKAIYGGGDGKQWGMQRVAVDAGVDILIATPGRLIQFMQLGIADLSHIDTLILDEADRMLDMGFFPDIKRIVEALPKERQTLLFSATMPPEVRELTRTMLRNPRSINIAVSRPAAAIQQRKLLLDERAKIGFLVQFFAARSDVRSAIVFAERKITVRELAMKLKRRGLDVESIHSDLSQDAREKALDRFRARQVRLLVATDIVARGIDIEDIDLVVNFNVPMSPESYVHRVGRTARASSSGESLTLASPREFIYLKEIETFLEGAIPELQPLEGVDMPRVSETFSPAGGRQRGRFSARRGRSHRAGGGTPTGMKRGDGKPAHGARPRRNRVVSKPQG